MEKRRIKLGEGAFNVYADEMAKNYFDVTEILDIQKQLNLAQDATIFDIGANIGISSLSFAWIYKQAKIYSFEPQPETYQALLKNIKLNELEARILPFNLGLSDVREQLYLSIPTAAQHQRYDSTLNKINAGLFSVHGEGEVKFKADFIALDDFFASRQVKNVNFLKIDVEGHEFEVLLGAEKVIGQHLPIIFLEYNDLTRTLSKYKPREYEKFFKAYGYHVYGIEKGAKTLQYLENFDGNIGKIHDILCVQNKL